jgi:uridine phosphorylase
MSQTIHLHPTAAQALLDEPKMFNHNRGLWGYSGTARDGAPLTIQTTGMGGPSAAIVVSELVELGAKRLLRVGTCGALVPTLSLGDILWARDAIAADGTSRALGADGRVPASPALAQRLHEAGATAATVVSTDLFYDPREGVEAEWVAAGGAAVEMETATLLALAHRHGVEAGALLIVSDLLAPSRARIGSEELRAAEIRAGETALRVLEV